MKPTFFWGGGAWVTGAGFQSQCQGSNRQITFPSWRNFAPDPSITRCVRWPKILDLRKIFGGDWAIWIWIWMVCKWGTVLLGALTWL